MNIFGLRWLLVMLGEVGWWGAHHSWWRLHLGPHWRGAVSHVRGDEGLKGLLGQRAPMLLEGRRSSWTRRVVVLGLQLLLMKLMRRRHSGGWLLIGKRWGNGEERKTKTACQNTFLSGSHAMTHQQVNSPERLMRLSYSNAKPPLKIICTCVL